MLEKMTQRLTLLKRKWSETEKGDVLESYEDVGKVWGNLAPFTTLSKGEDAFGKEMPPARYFLTLRNPFPVFNRIRYQNMEFVLASPLQMDFHKKMVTAILNQVQKETKQ